MFEIETWLGNYCAAADLSGTVVLTRTEAVNFNWSSASPGPGVPATNWSTRWTGLIEAPASGSYQLQTNSDDGTPGLRERRSGHQQLRAACADAQR